MTDKMHHLSLERATQMVFNYRFSIFHLLPVHKSHNHAIQCLLSIPLGQCQMGLECGMLEMEPKHIPVRKHDKRIQFIFRISHLHRADEHCLRQQYQQTHHATNLKLNTERPERLNDLI